MKRHPGTIGNQCPRTHVPRFAELLKARDCTRNSISEPKNSVFVKVAGVETVWVPSHSVTDVKVTGPAFGPCSLVEPLSRAVQGNLQVANNLVNASKTCCVIQVANHITKDVWLKPRTRLGTVRVVEQVLSRALLKFEMESNEAIVFRPLTADCQESPTLKPGKGANPQTRRELPSGVTLANFQGTAAEK